MTAATQAPCPPWCDEEPQHDERGPGHHRGVYVDVPATAGDAHFAQTAEYPVVSLCGRLYGDKASVTVVIHMPNPDMADAPQWAEAEFTVDEANAFGQALLQVTAQVVNSASRSTRQCPCEAAPASDQSPSTEPPRAEAAPLRRSASGGLKLLLSAEEVAQRLSISRTSVFQLLRHGELDSVQIGKARRISVAAVEAYVQRLCREAGQ